MTAFTVLSAVLLASIILDEANAQTIASPTHVYQLQKATFATLNATTVKYHIVDPDDSKLTKDQVTALKKQGKIILAYMCIGYVENYRDFWQTSWKTGSPAWLDEEQPDWPGNYWIKYWMPEAQDTIITFMKNHVLAKGYSGIYMDGVDTYEYFQDQGRETAATEMIAYIARIRSLAPGTLIFPQNAAELYHFPAYHGLIDGFGKEDTWYDDDKTGDYEDSLPHLRQAKKDGKVILSVDYPKKLTNVCTYYQKCFAEGFSCTVDDRALSGIVRTCYSYG